MTTEIPEDLPVKIETIRRIVESWIEWSGKSRSQEGLSTDGGTAIMSLPVPIWPTHSALENWVQALKEAEAAIRSQPDTQAPTKTEGAE